MNGVRLYSELQGDSGPALVLVHGSWGDHHNWDAVVPALARTFRVLTYDRRGHSASERLATQGSIEDDVADLAALIAARGLAPGARQFVETVALGPGMWEKLPPEMRQTFVFNAPTWLDEMNEPAAFALDLPRLSSFGSPVLMSHGDQSPLFFAAILECIAVALPRAQQYTFRGAGHVPHLTHPDDFATVVGSFISGVAAAVGSIDL